MTKCQITCKSPQKSSKCQDFLRVWHLVIFRAEQSKKPPCTSLIVVNRIWCVWHWHWCRKLVHIRPTETKDGLLNQQVFFDFLTAQVGWVGIYLLWALMSCTWKRLLMYFHGKSGMLIVNVERLKSTFKTIYTPISFNTRSVVSSISEWRRFLPLSQR